ACNTHCATGYPQSFSVLNSGGFLSIFTKANALHSIKNYGTIGLFEDSDVCTRWPPHADRMAFSLRGNRKTVKSQLVLGGLFDGSTGMVFRNISIHWQKLHDEIG